MTRYRVAVSSELLAARPWGEVVGWRIVSITGELTGFARDETICIAEDDEAPPELEGELVTPVFRHHGDGRVTVIAREVVSPHPS